MFQSMKRALYISKFSAEYQSKYFKEIALAHIEMQERGFPANEFVDIYIVAGCPDYEFCDFLYNLWQVAFHGSKSSAKRLADEWVSIQNVRKADRLGITKIITMLAYDDVSHSAKALPSTTQPVHNKRIGFNQSFNDEQPSQPAGFREAPPVFTEKPRTVLSTEQRESLSHIRAAGWMVSFNGKAWNLKKGIEAHELASGEEIQFFWKMLNK